MIVASGMASIAALTIAGGLFGEPRRGCTNPRDASEPRRDRVASSARPRPPPPSGGTPSSSNGARRHRRSPRRLPPVCLRPPPPPSSKPTRRLTRRPPSSDTNVVEVSTSTPSPAEYVLDIESIDLHEPVVAGDQDEIDQGYVTAVDWSSERTRRRVVQTTDARSGWRGIVHSPGSVCPPPRRHGRGRRRDPLPRPGPCVHGRRGRHRFRDRPHRR